MSIDDEAAGTGDDVNARARVAAREAKGAGDVKAREDHAFQETTEKLLRRAEQMRMEHMQHYQFRANVTMAVGIFTIIAGGAGFGWFFLVRPQPGLAFACLVAPLILYYVLHSWAREPLKNYAKHHKQVFMPEMARVLGNMRFEPRRGISEKVIRKAGVVPRYGKYRAEDCFLGQYKGARMIMCEARLSDPKSRNRNIFDGIFVFIEAPNAHFKGHTVITADSDMTKHIQNHWQGYNEIVLSASQYDHKFYACATDTLHARNVLSDAFLKELSEMGQLFDDATVSAAFFGGKYLFIAIPYDKDMFEPSNAMMPVTTRDHALTCKREIEQLISIIDILELYDTDRDGSAEQTL
jgi:hypothetical protein